MQHLGYRSYQVCSNDDPMSTLTNLAPRSNLLPDALKLGNFLKVKFLKTIEAKVTILT